jgi:hypothetical protein
MLHFRNFFRRSLAVEGRLVAPQNQVVTQACD